MSLRFIYGRAGSGKTRLCLNEIKQRIDQKSEQPLVLLVPEQFSFQAERDLVSVLDAGGILKTEVLSFQRMAFRIFNEAGGITYPHIHPAGKAMMISRILDKLRDSFVVFSRTAEREGFIQTVASLITEFKRYNVTPEQLSQATQELGADKPLSQKLKELNLIYTEFESMLAKRYRDSDDDLTLAAKKISESSLYRGAEIWIDGFNSFTPQEYIMIGELLKVAQSVTISLCADQLDMNAPVNEMDVFMPVKHAYKKLHTLADALKIKVEKPVWVRGEPRNRFTDSPELAHLERYLYAYPYKSYTGKTKDISLFSAVNIFSEIEAAARDIIRQCRDHNLRYRDIAVVTRNLADYEKLIEVIFAEYGIPCFIDRKVDISNHPLVRMILSMLDIFNENWSYEAVFRYLKTGLTDIKQADIDKLENYVLACGIRGSQWTGEKDWRMLPELMPDEKTLEAKSGMLYEINMIRKAVIAPLMDFRKRTKGRRPASEFCAGIYDFMLGLGIPDRIEKYIESFKSSGNLVLAGEYSQVWNTVMEVFDQLVEVMGDENITLERFSKLLKTGLGEYKIGLVPASLDQVLVGSAERSKSHAIKAMYILGVNDGVFPSAAAKEGILTDQERMILDHMGLQLASDTRTQAFDEQLMVYRTLTAPGNFLRISWPIADSEGRTMRPSIIISRLRKLFPEIDEKSNILPSKTDAQELELITCGKPAFRSMIGALRQKADGKEILPIWEQVCQWFAREPEWKQSLQTAREAFQYKNLAQQIKRDKIRALYGDPLISSVSRLEKYTACPFAFYVQYGLGAKERKIYRLSPPDIGTFMHAVIERFSKLVAKGDMGWRGFDLEWCRQRVSEIVDEMLEKMQGSGVAASKRYTALTARLKRVVTRAVWLIAEHIRRSDFNPIDYEVGFGDHEKYPPITIELDTGERISLTGRIDRVDALKTEDGSYLRIIDYKSGAKDFRLSDVYYGLQIQLITYLDAIWESQSNKTGEKILPGGMLYFKIDDPIIKSSGKLTQEEIEKSIMRQLKMKGLVLADVKLIKAMDKHISGSSMIIPATVNKDNVLGKNTSGATLDQFKILRGYVKKLLKDLGNEIVKGQVNIQPYKKKGATSCQYCSFSSVCQFDTTMKDNAFKLLYDKENDEVWNLMSKVDNE